MTDQAIHIPDEWEKIDNRGLSGLLMIVGGTDVGKSTFARFLYQRTCAEFGRVGLLDGDPGQNTLGPPCTMTLALSATGDRDFPPRGRSYRVFIGSVSPARHMLPVLVGAARLVETGWNAGLQSIIYDTTGLIEAVHGGTYLKLGLMDLVRPDVVFAIQCEKELETLLRSLRRSRRIRIVDIPSSPSVRHRDLADRRAYRTARYARYFADARPMDLHWPKYAVIPTMRFEPHRLVALENVDGFTEGLGIVLEIDHQSKHVILLTPMSSFEGVDTIRLGDVAVHPRTFEDRRLTSGS